MTQQPKRPQQTLDIIRNQHKALLLQIDRPGKVDIEQEVRIFLKTLAQGGTTIEDTEDRSLLQELIRYWSSFIGNKTREFPVMQLQPYDGTLFDSRTDERVLSKKDATFSLVFDPDVEQDESRQVGTYQSAPVATDTSVSSLTAVVWKRWQVTAVIVGTLLFVGLLVGAITGLFTFQWYIPAVLLAMPALGALIYLGYTSERSRWLGLGKHKRPVSGSSRRTTLLDWLALLVILVVLAAGAIGFRISTTQYTNDQQLAAEQQLETTLQTYLDRMSDLILNPNVHSRSQQGDDIRSLARARTLTILQQLDGPRKAFVLKFLYFGGVIKRQDLASSNVDPIVNLNGADFSRVSLSGLELSGADLAGVNLSGANLNGANLSVAYLSNANLSGANLSGAILCFAQLTGGANLSRTDLSGVHSSGTDLIGANLSNAKLNGANLSNADQTCAAQLPKGSTLQGADLSHVKLNGANLTNANLIGAVLVNAIFTDVVWKNTNCPDGTNSDTNGSGSCVGH